MGNAMLPVWTRIPNIMKYQIIRVDKYQIMGCLYSVNTEYDKKVQSSPTYTCSRTKKKPPIDCEHCNKPAPLNKTYTCTKCNMNLYAEQPRIYQLEFSKMAGL